MQTELNTEHPSLGIQILGVNGIGLEAANPNITDGRNLPWLQDVVTEDVWSSWNVTYRDVFVLDPYNQVYAVYNLTSNNLSADANYDTLLQLFLDAATAP
jgi:hypothetical protein